MYFLLVFIAGKLAFSKSSPHILSQSYERLSFQEASGNYQDSNYLSTHTANPLSYTSTGDKVGQNIEYAFHDDNNYWVSSLPNTDDFKSSIIITFKEPILLEAFLLTALVHDDDQNIRYYYGFPTKLKVYTDMTDDGDFTLSTLFTGTPVYPLSKAQFVFKNPIQCKRLKIEFIDVTENSEGQKLTIIKYLNFIQKLSYSDLKYSLPSGNYASSPYINFHKLIPDTDFEYISSGDYKDRPIKNAFDDKEDTFWIADAISDGTSSSHITINFKKQVLFEGFLIKGEHYSSWGKHYYPGIPKELILYAANGTDEFSRHTIFSGEPTNKKDQYQFILSEKVLCDKIQIKFVKVVNDDKFSKSDRVVIDQLTLFQSFENEGLVSHGVTGDYADSNFLSTRSVPANDYFLTPTGGFQNGHNISTTTIDDDSKTYWVSEIPNSDTFHNCVLVNFTHTVELEAVLIYPVYKTEKDNSLSFSGFPTILKIYSSSNNDEYNLISSYIGVPDNNNIRFQFVFPSTISCSKLKLEYVQVTPFVFDSDGSLYAGADKFVFIQKADYDYIEYHENTGFSESKIIPTNKFSFSSTGHKDSHVVENLFDDDNKNYWESGFENSDEKRASIFINFTQPLKLEEFLIGAYIGTFNGYFGYPTKLNVYASENDDEPLKLRATFIGDPNSGDFFQFTLREPFVCTRLQIEFIDINYNLLHEGGKPYAAISYIKFIGEMIDFSNGNLNDDFYTQHVNKSFPLKGINDTYFVVNDLPVDNDYLFVVEKQFFFNNVSFTCPDALMSAIKSNHSNKVTVVKCQFNRCSVKSDIGNGGAILSLNCVLKCEVSNFTNCHSKTNGGGGGICIILNENVDEEVTINKCSFSQCSATYGGALYLFSNISNNAISVKGCIFESNSIIDSSSSDSDSLFGGSAIYIHAQKSIVQRCKFAKNSGDSSVVVNNNYDNVPSRFLKGIFFKSPVIIDDCEFEIDSSSKSSISYVHDSKKGVDIDVSNCIFSGELVDGAHHIFVNSKANEIGKSKLNIKSCKFTCDVVKSINLNLDEHLSKSLVAFDLNNQIFNYNRNSQGKNDDESSNNDKTSFILSISFIFVAVAATIALIIVFSMKKLANEESDDYKDSLNHPLDITDL